MVLGPTPLLVTFLFVEALVAPYSGTKLPPTPCLVWVRFFDASGPGPYFGIELGPTWAHAAPLAAMKAAAIATASIWRIMTSSSLVVGRCDSTSTTGS